MSDKEASYGTNLSQESMKVIAESIGIANLPEEAARELADEVSYRLKLVLQVPSSSRFNYFYFSHASFVF
jgi:transcription initiation factor TFIID subunit 6